MSTDIQISRTKEEPGATTLTVEAPLATVQALEDKVTGDLARRAHIPGFRKGKVPKGVVRKRFGPMVKESVIRELIEDSWKLAVKQESLEPIADPQVRELKFEDNEPVTFELLVEVKPEITLERISGFTVNRHTAAIDEDQINEQIDAMRREHAPLVPLEGVAPGPGDHVQVEIAMLDGTDEEPKPYNIVLGAGQALEVLEEQIMTVKPGQTEERSITFPADFTDESKRGQSVTTRIHLVEAKCADLPAADDDFAKEVGDFETFDALKRAVKEDLENHAKRESDGQVRRDLLNQIVTANNVPAPAPQVDRLLRVYAETYRVDEAGFEQFHREFRPIIEEQIRRDLVMQSVANANDLKATEDELDERVEALAERRNTDPGQLYASLQKEGGLAELERSITDEKVYAFLLEQSTITEN